MPFASRAAPGTIAALGSGAPLGQKRTFDMPARIADDLDLPLRPIVI